MNRVLYQLSYAAIGERFRFFEISLLIIHTPGRFVKKNIHFFLQIYAVPPERKTPAKNMKSQE